METYNTNKKKINTCYTKQFTQHNLLIILSQMCAFASDFPEAGVKGIFRHLLSTLPIYHDPPSRRAVASVVAACAKSHPKATIKHLVAALSDFASSMPKTRPWLVCP